MQEFAFHFPNSRLKVSANDFKKMNSEKQKQNHIYTCGYCHHSFARIDNYKRHMRCHTGQLFKCDMCELRYNTKYRLQKHKESKHGVANCK